MSKIIPALLFALLLLMASACSNTSLRGTYEAQGLSPISTMTFLGGGKVELSNMMMTSMGTYEVDGNRVIITANDDTIVFTIENVDRCIKAGGLLGTYCRS